MRQQLRKSTTDKVLTGVCGGIADFFGIAPFIVRVIFIFTNPVSFWIYIFLSVSLKDESYL